MNEKFKNKYRIPSTRLQDWDYSSNGYYFLTICTKNREHYFGEIVDDEMRLSETGQIAKKYWLGIQDHFPFVVLDEFVVMPNHIHGIIVIDKNNGSVPVFVETQNFASLQFGQRLEHQNKFGPQSKNLASIIRGFKIGVKKYATLNNINFVWQPRFYDHIIRDEKSLNRIREYIRNNPMNWENDRNNLENLWI